MEGKTHIIKKLIYLFRRRIDIQTYWQYFRYDKKFNIMMKKK